MSRTATIAAAALFASLVPGTASAATARILPVQDRAGVGTTTVNVALSPEDDCRFRIVEALYEAAPGGRIMPVWHSSVTLVNGCLGRNFEDGSILESMGLRVPTARLRAGRAIVQVAISTRRMGGPWAIHSYVRSFWHSTRAAYELPTVRLADCATGPC